MNYSNLSYSQAVDIVKVMRKDKGISQRAMCVMVSVSISVYNKFETDKDYCNYELLVRVCRKLGITPYISLS